MYDSEPNKRVDARPGTQQLGFDALLADADQSNRVHMLARETAHLPDTKDVALDFCRQLVARHHDAMLSARNAVTALCKKARHLGGPGQPWDPGILALWL
jgi:hypothetical protein